MIEFVIFVAIICTVIALTLAGVFFLFLKFRFLPGYYNASLKGRGDL